MGRGEKKISFFRLYQLRNGQRVEIEQCDWPSRFAVLAKKPLMELEVEGKLFDPQVHSGRAYLGMHSPLKTDYMTTIDRKAGKVSDLLAGDEGSADEDEFAHSSIAAFLPRGDVFALILGSGASSPQQGALATFLNAHVPAGEGAHWKAEPLLDRGQLQVLRDQSGGVSLYSTKFSTQRDLFDDSDRSDGIASFADQVAERVGGDVEIDVTVRLVADARNTSNFSRFRDFVLAGLLRTAQRGSGAKARALVDGTWEDLDLVPHRLAATIDVDPDASESRRYSMLFEHLKDVSARMESRVDELLKG